MELMDLSSSSRGNKAVPTQDLTSSWPILMVALLVWLFDRRMRGDAPLGHQLASMVNTLKSLAPELLGFLLCVAVAAGLIYCGEHNGGAAIPKEEQGIWNAINKEWWVLSTADTLIGLQAMLRMVLLTSAAVRLGAGEETSSFASEPAFFFFAAAACRVALLIFSPWDVYHLDGPLGGALNMACEVTALPLLAWPCVPMLRHSWRRLVLVAITVIAALVVALCHHLGLADHGAEFLDVLFSFSRLLEFAAAAAFLLRTCAMGSSSNGYFTCFAHLLLPLQQVLGVYFMLTAWDAAPFKEVPELVGEGHPLLMLQVTGLAEVAFYLASFTAYFATRTTLKDAMPFLQARVPLHIEV